MLAGIRLSDAFEMALVGTGLKVRIGELWLFGEFCTQLSYYNRMVITVSFRENS